MALITFARVAAPSGSWSPAKNPGFPEGYHRVTKRYQPKAISDGGDVYVYSHGSQATRELVWTSLSDTDLADLLTFVAAMAGGVYKFTFTDTDATAYTASRILSADNLVYRKVATNMNEVYLMIEVA